MVADDSYVPNKNRGIFYIVAILIFAAGVYLLSLWGIHTRQIQTKVFRRFYFKRSSISATNLQNRDSFRSSQIMQGAIYFEKDKIRIFLTLQLENGEPVRNSTGYIIFKGLKTSLPLTNEQGYTKLTIRNMNSDYAEPEITIIEIQEDFYIKGTIRK